MGDIDVKLVKQIEGTKLQNALPDGEIASKIEKGSAAEGNMSTPDTKVLSVEGKPLITCDERIKVMDMLNKVSAALRDTSSKLLKEEISKLNDKSVEPLQSPSLDGMKIEKDLMELLKLSEECLLAFKKKTKGESTLCDSDLIPTEVEECMKKLDHVESPTILGESEAFLLKMGPILHDELCKANPESLMDPMQEETESETKVKTLLDEDVDFTQKSLADLVTDLKKIDNKELKERLFKGMDKFTEETNELTELIDSLEISNQSRSVIA